MPRLLDNIQLEGCSALFVTIVHPILGEAVYLTHMFSRPVHRNTFYNSLAEPLTKCLKYRATSPLHHNLPVTSEPHRAYIVDNGLQTIISRASPEPLRTYLRRLDHLVTQPHHQTHSSSNMRAYGYPKNTVMLTRFRHIRLRDETTSVGLKVTFCMEASVPTRSKGPIDGGGTYRRVGKGFDTRNGEAHE